MPKRLRSFRMTMSVQNTAALFFVLFCLLLPASAETAEEAPVFSNQDLRQYGTNPPGDETEEDTVGKQRRQKEAETTMETKKREYWCKKATPYRRTVEETRDELRETEELLSAERAKNLSRNKRIPALEKKETGLKKKIRKAERNLGDLEDEAYRKGIPQGWVRCQFE